METVQEEETDCHEGQSIQVHFLFFCDCDLAIASVLCLSSPHGAGEVNIAALSCFFLCSSQTDEEHDTFNFLEVKKNVKEKRKIETVVKKRG